MVVLFFSPLPLGYHGDGVEVVWGWGWGIMWMGVGVFRAILIYLMTLFMLLHNINFKSFALFYIVYYCWFLFTRMY